MHRFHFSAAIALMAMLTGSVAAQTSSRAADANNLTPAPYWIGVRCVQVGDEKTPALIRAMDVIASAPAAKAGLQDGDQIVAVNDEKLKTVEDLVRLIQASEGDDLRVLVKRDDEEFEVKVSPERRRAMAYTWPELRAHNLAEWLQSQARNGRNPGIDMTLINPGVVLESSSPRFPANTSFTLKRQADEPIALTVQRGDETWSVTGESIDQLPEDLRSWAERLLSLANSKTPLIPQLPPDIHLLLPAPMHRLRTVPSPQQQSDVADTERTDLHKRFDELSRQMDVLRQAIEQRKVESD